MCVALLIIIVIMIICFLRNSKEDFRFNVSSASSMVLTDSDGNLSSIPFPKGIVVIWSGSLANIPSGWALCDGTQGTPDLRGRFVMGVNPSDNKNILTARPMGTTGGSETNTLTVEQMPAHTHKILQEVNNSCNCGGGGCACGGLQYKADSLATGEGKPHPIVPPYYALAYIMKL